MKAFVISIIIAVSPPLCSTSQASLVDVSFSPDKKNVLGLNQTFSFDILGNYTPDGTEKLLGGALDLIFNQNILNVRSVTLNTPTDIAASTGNINNLTGSVNTIGFATFSGLTGGPFPFASIEFESVGFGQSPLQMFDSNDLVFAWTNENFDPVTVNSINGVVNVTPVPLPAAAWLFISGLGGLLALMHQRGTS